MVGTAVVFPIVFSIGGAYKRREGALDDYAVMKAHGTALYFATPDWIDDTDDDLQGEIRALLFELLDASRTLSSSRLNQFLSKMIIAFESVKHVYQYRTPVTLRAYFKVFIYLIPVLFGPYFAAISLEYSSSLTYVMPTRRCPRST